MRLGRIALALFALACVALSLMNASWIAARPAGHLILLAHGGIAQPYDAAAIGCTARAIRPSGQNFIENTLFSMQNAIHYGAGGLLLDVRASADGRAVIFRDATLDCRTDGTGAIADRPLGYLKTLDVGYGYTADGGRTFPLRGRGIGGMPTLEEVLLNMPRSRFVYALADPRAADALVAAYARAGRRIDAETGFVGDAGGATRLKRRMIERVLTRCADAKPADIAPLLTLLRRFATEAAREEARLFCDEIAAEAGIVPPAQLQAA